MASICSLPTELLFQIFTDEVISSNDLAQCAATCKLFNDIKSQCKINYNFRVDHPSRSAWKLIRHLLLDPKIGERFQSITVTWHRRVPRHPKTWALEWNWGKTERQEINRLCEEWGLSEVAYHIRCGWNSEALIPLLLCFTTKLESFDYGRSVLEIMHPSPTAHEGIRVHEYCEGKSHRWEPKGDHDDGFDWFDVCWNFVESGTSWFYSVLDRDTPLPGLSSLRKFSHRGCVDDVKWPGVYLPQVMLLPQLEDVVLISKPAKVGHLYPSTPKLEFPAGKKSSIKRLELIDCSFFEGEVDALAEFTGSLTRLNYDLCGFRRKKIVDSFLQTNGSLTKDRVTNTHTPQLLEEEEEEEEEEDFGSFDSDSKYEFSCYDRSSSDDDDDDDEEEEGE
ncbi:hypothetical protein TWF506_008467 [Arthrobotrys conoides]|uniref:F-box domain-containing protein n=1 Tax=Arthrobotrys conoides TaxID=74498 RepID=A0AAN8RMR8_9PEZI